MEPIFHAPAFGGTSTDFERRMADDYWEVGASGKRYSRDFILKELNARPPAVASELGWTSYDHALRSLGSHTYLLTYVLQQGDRLTRRATIWQKNGDDWRILYHQGTVASGDRAVSSA